MYRQENGVLEDYYRRQQVCGEVGDMVEACRRGLPSVFRCKEETPLPPSTK